MVVNPDGTITGTAPAGTTSLLSFTVQATDANGSTGVRIFQINLRSGQATLTFTQANLPSAVANSAYSVAITASGGQGPYAFAGMGTLPAGLSLSITGVLAGTPTVPGTFGIHVQATDANGVIGTVNYVLTISGPSPGTNILTVDPAEPEFHCAQGRSASPAPQSISVFSSGGSASFSVTASGGSWLSVSSGIGQTPGSFLVSINKSGLASGTTYNGQVTITAQNATPATINSGDAYDGGRFCASLGSFTFANPTELRARQPADHQQLVVSNLGSGVLSANFHAQTASCGSWLAPANGSASVTTGVPLVLDFTLDPSGLPAGTCTGEIVVTGDAGQSQAVPITMVINDQSQSLLLSQTGLDFQVAQGSSPSNADVWDRECGHGRNELEHPLVWDRMAEGNPSERCRCRRGACSIISERNSRPAGLGFRPILRDVEVDAPGAGNSPKSVTVSLRVLDARKLSSPDATPSGLILVGQTAQGVTLANYSSAIDLFIDRGDRRWTALALGYSDRGQCAGERNGADQHSSKPGRIEPGVVARDY